MDEDDFSDGFSDAGGDSEHQDRAWVEVEANAMERRSRTVGFREGLDVGKEETLQEGFNEGYAAGAAHGFRSGVLQGLLRSFAHQYPDKKDLVQDVLASLRAKERTSIEAGEIPSTDGADTQAVHDALAPFLPALPEAAHLHEKKNHASG
ncbi:Aste57867_18344 [Aphanomyces stellatus]|uniref:Aste57867_18344 protein n=1 Tax=Aphanomyces stellatus TaxID=120398 RepID=A0A485L9V1_9STRA|nr:hypothetical protein As57867_018282 [Aphanomyces stellatus]VFT95080.1 Aste57867_18344 [Aphanomyces stellatus]